MLYLPPHELQQRLLNLVYIYSYRSGTFTLSSGRKSNYYIDGKQVTMTPEGLCTAAQYILTSLQQRRAQIDAIGGPTLGADPIAAAVTILARIGHKQMPFLKLSPPPVSFIVRKGTKKHGTRAQIEGPFQQGMRVIIVDDVLTTGGSVLKAAAAVEEAGGSVSAIYILVDRQEGGREAIEKAGYTLETAVKRDSLEKLQQETEQRFPVLSSFLKDEKISWGELPLEELQSEYPLLAAALKKLALTINTAANNGAFDRFQLQQTAGKVFVAVKAAVYHPEGEREAIRLVQLMQNAGLTD